MMPERRRARRQLFRYGNALVALAASAVVLGLLAAGHGSLPALGSALVPGHGVWTSAAGGKLPADGTLAAPGLTKPVRVTFSQQGVASISAPTADDAFLAQGYVHAAFRLTEMDLERRQAEGRLAQLAGPSAVASDKFELRLGLLRTAQQEWAAMPKSSPAAQALIWYARGVNDYLAKLRADGQWPAVFSLAGVYPANWTPVDSLAVQGDLTQELDLTTTPLNYELLERSLGAQRTMEWFPVLPPNQQNPYDTGPYRNIGVAPITTAGRLTAAGGGPAGAGVAVSDQAGRGSPAQPSGAAARAATAILAQAAALPAGQLYSAPASNAWAANGPRVAGGGAMLAGDPHLPQTLPSVWYQVALSAPGYDVSGVSVPGLPGILIGHNAHIAWSLTDTQNQATLFYAERTSPSRPGEYFWDGQWRRMRQLHYSIAVRGGPAQSLTVDLTVHGPVMTQAGQTTAVDWMGAAGSPDVAVMFAVGQATDFAQFKAALANWRSPAMNFVYADDRGNIGAISAGYYPVVRQGQPWLPLPGTGADDVAGVIPYQAVPQVYDPPGHVVATANQRPVTAAYPYYIGTSADFFDPGYRASREYAYLSQHSSMRPAAFAALQNDLTDPLAARILPSLLAALRGARLTAVQKSAQEQLASWNRQMTVTSPAASIWWTFWADYLSAVFRPWWAAAHVPVHADRSGLSISPEQSSLDEVLETWTLHAPQNAAFSPPGGPRRSAPGVMRTAFDAAVAHLSATLGGGPGTWTWGRLHTRQFPSLTGAAALGYGPKPASGTLWSVDAAEGGLKSTIGPSWRMIVGWSGAGRPVAEGIYPGGQSENPASPWYTNLVGDWWNGRYLPMPWLPAGGAPPAASAASASAASGPSGASASAGGGAVSWELQP
jgi:penicillin amidase